MFSSISNLAGSFSDPYAPSPVDDSSSYEPDGFCAEASEPVFAVDWLVAPAHQSYSPSQIPFDAEAVGINPDGLSFDCNTNFFELCQQLKGRDDISSHAYFLCSRSEFLKGFIHRHTIFNTPPIYGEFVSDHLSECFLSFIQRFVFNSPLMYGACLFLNKLVQDLGATEAIELIKKMGANKFRILARQLDRLTSSLHHFSATKYFILPYATPLSKSELIQLSSLARQ
ncbi:hypothetical protein [Parashewanella tropica]|uniref:hypothetical protein n=1 Tax=Parashewanella tropica TaxID=2547970 RepID=UPI001059BA2E|nr:hypothetical protein [Parashewanella tropica]